MVTINQAIGGLVIVLFLILMGLLVTYYILKMATEKGEKHTIDRTGELLVRSCIKGLPATVMPQLASFPIKTVWRFPVPLLCRLFGRTQIYQLVTQIVVYPPLDDGRPDVDRGVVTMTITRQLGSTFLKGKMESDWDEAWDALELMKRTNPNVFKIVGSRDDTPWK